MTCIILALLFIEPTFWHVYGREYFDLRLLIGYRADKVAKLLLMHHLRRLKKTNKCSGRYGRVWVFKSI